METIVTEFFGGITTVLGEIFSGLWTVMSKVVLFGIWALLALVILPCVFVAGHIYPLWQEWGEEF